MVQSKLNTVRGVRSMRAYLGKQFLYVRKQFWYGFFYICMAVLMIVAKFWSFGRGEVLLATEDNEQSRPVSH